MAGGLTYTVEETTKLSTAEIYAKVLADLAEEHPEIVTLTPDLAKSTKVGVFEQRFPDRFYNFGIAEANMIGAAAGMAACGLVPFTSSFAIFNSMRALDQVHTDVCYPNLPVKMIGSHAGLSFGQAGTTHHCTEDLAIMRSMANLAVICPADGIETANAVVAAYERPGPVYLRINRGFDQVVYDRMDYGFEIGRAVQLHEGTDLTLIACGSGVFQAVQAAQELAATDGVQVRVLNMHTIKPIDAEGIRAAVQETRRIITVEDHTVIGGAGRRGRRGHRGGRAGLRLPPAGPVGLLLPHRAARGPDEPPRLRHRRHRQHGPRGHEAGLRGHRRLGRRVLMGPSPSPSPSLSPSPSPSHSPSPSEEELASVVFLRGVLPLVKILAAEDPALRAAFAGTDGVVQVSARCGAELRAVHFLVVNGAVEVRQGAYERPDVELRFRSLGAFNGFFRGTSKRLPRIRGLSSPRRVRLFAAFLRTLLRLSALLGATEPPTSERDKALVVRLYFALLSAGISGLNRAGHPEIAAWVARSPDRVYAWAVDGHPEVAAYLRVKAGRTKAARGEYRRSKPFFTLRFDSLDSALGILLDTDDMLASTAAGKLIMEGAPEFGAQIGAFMLAVGAYAKP